MLLSLVDGSEVARKLLTWELSAAVSVLVLGSRVHATAGDTAFCIEVASATSAAAGDLCKLVWRTPLLEDLGRQGAILTAYSGSPAGMLPWHRVRADIQPSDAGEPRAAC